MKILPDLFDSQDKIRNPMFQAVTVNTLRIPRSKLWGTSMTTYEKHVKHTLTDTSLYRLQINEMFTYLNRPAI